MDAIRPEIYSSQAKADTWGLIHATARTHMASNNAYVERLTYLRRFKYKKLLSSEEGVAEPLIFSCFIDTMIRERNANGVDGLLNRAHPIGVEGS
jgi:hypothetical protein